MKDQKVLLKVENLQKYFPLKKKSIFQRELEYVKANKDISLEIYEGETLGLVGESGCGKSTFGRTLIQLYEQTGGTSLYYDDSVDNILPEYVKHTYKNIPNVMPTYKEDLEKLNELDNKLVNSSGEEHLALVEEFRLAKIAFEKKYGNTLRLAGGLLVHDNLNEISNLLLEKYEEGSSYSKVFEDLQFVRLREEMASSSKNQARIDELEKQLVKEKELVDVVDEKIAQMKKKLSSHPDFDHFESKLDEGIDLSALNKKEMRKLRKDLQIIFQDPYSSLDPRLTVGNIIGEGLIAHGLFKDNKSEEYQNYIVDIMEKSGLPANYIHRYPHQFSGGQRQRIGIARALALQPKFIVCDEAVSALDVSIQSQIINLLQDLKDEQNLTYLFITHDLGVVRYISDRIGVMYFGNLVELAPAEEIFNNPQHPYTRELLNAIPKMNRPGEKVEPLPLYEENDIFDFTFKETGEADHDWYEVSPEHFVACRLKNKENN